MLGVLSNLIGSIIYFYILIVIIWAIASTLVSFNILNNYDPFIRKMMNALDRLVLPALRPIQKYMPNLGGIDLSPIVLIFLLTFVQNFIGGLSDARYALFAIVNLISGLLTLYMYCVLALAILGTLVSFRFVNLYQPLVQTVMVVLRRLCDPALTPLRKYIRPVGRLDITPFILFALLYALDQALWMAL
jgi:YggT family protein